MQPLATLPHPATQMSIKVAFSTALLLLGIPIAPAATPASWPQFRGANGAGVATDARPPVKIGPTEGVIWSVEVPWSPSSPCVWGDRIFLTTFNEGQLEVRCHDAADGRVRWSRQIKPDGIEE